MWVTTLLEVMSILLYSCSHIVVCRLEESTGPCLPRASRRRVLDIVRFSTIIDHAFSYQPSANKLFIIPKKCVLSPRHPWDSRSLTLPKIHQLSSFSRVATIKRQKQYTPKSTKIYFCDKFVFAIHSMREPGLLSRRRINFDPEIDEQNDMDTSLHKD